MKGGFIMFPQHLKKLGLERIEPYQTEGFVPGKGPQNPKIMLIGEAPGRNEIVQGEPFIGRAGDKLTEFMEYIGLTREEIYITSVVRSRPYKIVETTDKEGNKVTKTPNRAPNQKEILAHAPLLDYQIQEMDPEIIVTLGNIALKRLVGKAYKISESHGKLIKSPILELQDLEDKHYVWSDQVYKVFPLYHPAAIFYNGGLLQEIYKDLDALSKILSEEE